MKKNSLIFVLMFFCIICACFAIKANAQTEGSIDVTPQVIDEKVRARDILKYEIKIKNNKDHRIEMFTTVDDINATSGEQQYTDPNTLDKTISITRWISINRNTLEIDAGKEIMIPLEIKVDLAAKPGKRHATITFSEGRNITEAEISKRDKNQPRIMINMEVTEDVIEKSEVKIFKTNKKIYFKYPVIFNLEIDNVGNEVVSPRGDIFIYNRRGEEVTKLTVNPEAKTVAPNEKQDFSEQWNDGRGFGKFKAKLEVEYGQKSIRDLQESLDFWFIPLYLLIAVAVGLFMVIFILSILIFKKTYHHPHLETAPKKDIVINLRNENKK